MNDSPKYFTDDKQGERCKNCGWWLKEGIHHQYGNSLWSCDGHMPHCRPDCTTKHESNRTTLTE